MNLEVSVRSHKKHAQGVRCFINWFITKSYRLVEEPPKNRNVVPERKEAGKVQGQTLSPKTTTAAPKTTEDPKADRKQKQKEKREFLRKLREQRRIERIQRRLQLGEHY